VPGESEAKGGRTDRAKKRLVVFGLAEASFLVDKRFDLHPGAR
jgi:hypothetical protein